MMPFLIILNWKRDLKEDTQKDPTLLWMSLIHVDRYVSNKNSELRACDGVLDQLAILFQHENSVFMSHFLGRTVRVKKSNTWIPIALPIETR